MGRAKNSSDVAGFNAVFGSYRGKYVSPTSDIFAGETSQAHYERLRALADKGEYEDAFRALSLHPEQITGNAQASNLLRNIAQNIVDTPQTGREVALRQKMNLLMGVTYWHSKQMARDGDGIAHLVKAYLNDEESGQEYAHFRCGQKTLAVTLGEVREHEWGYAHKFNCEDCQQSFDAAYQGAKQNGKLGPPVHYNLFDDKAVVEQFALRHTSVLARKLQRILEQEADITDELIAKHRQSTYWHALGQVWHNNANKESGQSLSGGAMRRLMGQGQASTLAIDLNKILDVNAILLDHLPDTDGKTPKQRKKEMTQRGFKAIFTAKDFAMVGREAQLIYLNSLDAGEPEDVASDKARESVVRNSRALVKKNIAAFRQELLAGR